MYHRPPHYILIFIAYAQKPSLNAHVDVSRSARCLELRLSLHLHPYFVYARSAAAQASPGPSLLNTAINTK